MEEADAVPVELKNAAPTAAALEDADAEAVDWASMPRLQCQSILLEAVPVAVVIAEATPEALLSAGAVPVAVVIAEATPEAVEDAGGRASAKCDGPR